MSFAGATAFANAEAECPNRINRVLAVRAFYSLRFSCLSLYLIRSNPKVKEITYEINVPDHIPNFGNNNIIEIA